MNRKRVVAHTIAGCAIAAATFLGVPPAQAEECIICGDPAFPATRSAAAARLQSISNPGNTDHAFLKIEGRFLKIDGVFGKDAPAPQASPFIKW